MSRRNVISAIVGLLAAWGGTALLVSPVALSLGRISPVAVSLFGQVALWLLCAGVVGIVLFWERKPLTSLWIRPFQYQSFVWAAVLIFVHVILIFPLTEWVRKSIGLQGYAAGVKMALTLPLWVRIPAVLTAGVVEEILFRGYPVTRLASLTGSAALAGFFSSAGFSSLYFSILGAGASLAFFICGFAAPSFFFL